MVLLIFDDDNYKLYKNKVLNSINMYIIKSLIV